MDMFLMLTHINWVSCLLDTGKQYKCGHSVCLGKIDLKKMESKS